MTVGRSDNPQNTKLGEYVVLEEEAPLHHWSFRTRRDAATGIPSTKDAVPRLGLHLSS